MIEKSALVDRIRDRLPRSPPTYECGFCSQSFDRDPPNCPACGCTVIVES